MPMRLSHLAATAGLVISIAAAAQPAPPTDDRAARIQQRIAETQAGISRDLATLLDIKPNQRAALDAFLASMAPSGSPRQRPGDGAGAAETEPARLARLKAMEQRHAAMIDGRIEATQRFYAALDSHQQQQFDALMRLRREMKRRPGGRHGAGFAGGGRGRFSLNTGRQGDGGFTDAGGAMTLRTNS